MTAETCSIRREPAPRETASAGAGLRRLSDPIVWVLLLAAWLGGLGPISPLLIVSATGLLFLTRPQACFEGLLRCWPLLVVMAIVCLSTVWSISPDVSLRLGVQLALTVVAGVFIASTVEADRFVRGIFLSCAVILVLSVASGRQGPSVDGPVLIGILGSKNSMGILCQLIVCSGLAVAVSRRSALALRLSCVPVCAVAAFVLVSSDSAGAILSALVFLAVFLVLALASRIPLGTRIALGVLLAGLLLPLWMVRGDLAILWETFLTQVLHKDVGLTGRDYLWSQADQLIRQRPVLGHGFRASWLSDTTDTTGLLRYAGVKSGEGFSFHDTYREWLVDFGFLGGVPIAAALAAGLAGVLVRAMSRGRSAAVVFLGASAVVFIVRAKVEPLFGPFAPQTLLLMSAAAFGLLPEAYGRVAADGPDPAPDDADDRAG